MNKPQFWNLIIGMVLGDAYVSPRHNLRINHSIKQRTYLEYKANILSQLTRVNIREYIGKAAGEEYPMIMVETLRHPWYEKLHDRCYRNGRKEINSFMMKHLGLEGIALWFGDDGSIETRKNFGMIHTNSFSEAENYLAKEWLAKKGLYCSVGKRRQYYYLRFDVNSTEKIINKAKEMKIPLTKVSSYDRPPLDLFRRENGTFIKGHKNESRWGDDMI